MVNVKSEDSIKVRGIKACVILLMLSFLMVSAFAQPRLDSVLIKKITAMTRDLKKWRSEYMMISIGKKSQYAPEFVKARLNEVDARNTAEAKIIIDKYGFPRFNLIGEASEDFWLIVLNSDQDLSFQEAALKLMKIEIDKDNACKQDYAYLMDRVLAGKGQKQIYGTQRYRSPITHKMILWPIQDSINVDKRRHQMGLSPLESIKLPE